MGKDLKGKELGIGITQRKDGYYVGRYTTFSGKRKQKIFKKFQECRKWVANAEYDDKHRNLNFPDEILVSEWYNYWIGMKKRKLRISTINTYETNYKNYIKPVIGDKMLAKVTSMDCQLILNNRSDAGMKTASIKNIKIILKDLLEYAVQNDVLSKNPCGKRIEYKIGQKSNPRKALTIDEQKTLCKGIIGNEFEYVYVLALQTGLRIGEISGLQWSDVDLKNKAIHIRHSLSYDSKIQSWRIGDPKSEAGFRKVPLTAEAIRVLSLQKEKDKQIESAEQEWESYVFLRKNGTPLIMGNVDSALRTVCRRVGIREISMHILRHTFATRCIEGGMLPKTLQTLLGHADITTTMNLYVDTTEDQSEKEIYLVESALSVNGT